MTNAHTPGPYWMAADCNPADGSDREVFDVGVGDECLATFDRRQDALLYRSAPDMLEALKAAEIAVEELCTGQDEANECWNILRTVRAAIAKAEGVK